MMREERFKCILGILLMPVLMLVVVGFCIGRAGNGEVKKWRAFLRSPTGKVCLHGSDF